MWIVGALVSYPFYRFSFVWYFNFYFFSNPLQRPLSWRSPWFHVCVVSISIALLLTSAYFFYLSSPWLILLSIPVVIGSYVVFGLRRGAREGKIIHKAVQIQARMEKQGAKQSAINRALAVETLGDHDPALVDREFADFLKYGILDRAGLLKSEDPKMLIAQLQGIDTLIAKRRIVEGRNLQS